MYYIRMHDVIQSVNGIEGNLTQIQNAGDARFSGFDVSLHYLILKNLDLTTSYSFIIQKNKTNPELRFTDVPKHKAWSNLLYQPTNWAKVSITHDYYSRRYSRSYGITADEFHRCRRVPSVQSAEFTFLETIHSLWGNKKPFRYKLCLCRRVPRSREKLFYETCISTKLKTLFHT